jgi:methyl-accepting chemotaxis protein
MKKRLSELFDRVISSRRKRPIVIAVLSACLLVPSAHALGLGDILTLIKTITNTLLGPIGGALNGIQDLNSILNRFRQEIIWPVSELSQIRASVNSTIARYRNLMSQIHNIKDNSATLANPAQLEAMLRSGVTGSLGQLSPTYTKVYAPVPPPSDALPVHRNVIDMDDALAMGSLKTTVLSDQTTQRILAIADEIEQQSAASTPGSAPMLAAQAQVADLETLASMSKMLAAELRQEAARLGHQNTLLKQSAASTRNLQNQIQQVLTQP